MEKAYGPSHEPQIPVDLKSSSSASLVHTTPPKRRKALWRQAPFDESFAQVRAAQHPLGHLPLVVLTHGLQIFPDPQEERDWQALQRELVGLSSNSIQIIATRSGHHIQLDQPDLVIAAVKQVLTGKV